jgi:predicted RecB family nuclease
MLIYLSVSTFRRGGGLSSWTFREEVVYDFSTLAAQDLWDDYEATLVETRSILARQLVPLPAYGSVCKLCHWHTFCITQLTAADDLTLIPFLRRTDRDIMRDQIPTIAEADPMLRTTGPVS